MQSAIDASTIAFSLVPVIASERAKSVVSQSFCSDSGVFGQSKSNIVAAKLPLIICLKHSDVFFRSPQTNV